jgi:hypothetical protein
MQSRIPLSGYYIVSCNCALRSQMANVTSKELATNACDALIHSIQTGSGAPQPPIQWVLEVISPR